MMERKTVDFYFDYTSPYSYLAFSQLERLEAAGADIRFRPVFLGGIISTLSITPPIQQPGHSRARYVMSDIARWAGYYGIPVVMNPHFPVNTLGALRATRWAEAQGKGREWAKRCFDAVWVDGLDLADESVLRGVAADVGLDADALVQSTRDPATKQWLKSETDAAIERGVFGVPTFFVDDEQIWGNDRVHFVERALQGTL